MLYYLKIAVIFAVICVAKSFPAATKIQAENIANPFVSQTHGGGLKRLKVDTWITPQQYQLLINNDIPVDQSKAFSELNSVPSIYEYPTEFRYEQQIWAAISKINKTQLTSTLTTFSSFHNRYYQAQTGVDSSEWLFENIVLAANNTASNVEITKVTHTWRQPSIVARFVGKNPRDPIVIIGAHQDSTAGNANALAPGADDNGAGSMTLLGVFRILAEAGFVSNRTVEFHWYAAEEAGLLGSKEIASDYKARQVPVYAMLNYDVLGFNKRSNPKIIGVITDFVDPALTVFLRTVVEKFSLLPWGNTICTYACSDHAGWEFAGYPAAYLRGAEKKDASPDMHTARDTMDTVDMDHVVEFSKISLGYVYELGY